MTVIATEDTLLTKIAALLRKAESTDSEHEAEALVAKAQELSTLASIDIELARQFVPAHERRETPVQKHIPIGEPRKMGLATYCELFMAIGRANDLKFNIAHNSTYVIAFGFPSDIEKTEALYASLVVQMVNASNAYIKKGEYKNELRWSDRHWEKRPVSGRTARISFQEAFASQIGSRLWKVRQETIEARATAERNARGPVPALNEAVPEPTGPTSVALVLKAKNDEVEDYYKAKSRARGSWKGGQSRGRSYSSHASNAGRNAGDQARLGLARGLRA